MGWDFLTEVLVFEQVDRTGGGSFLSYSGLVDGMIHLCQAGVNQQPVGVDRARRRVWANASFQPVDGFEAARAGTTSCSTSHTAIVRFEAVAELIRQR